MTYLNYDELTFEDWYSLVEITLEYYNYLGWDNLSQQETELLLSHGFKITLDKELSTILHNYLEEERKIKEKENENNI